MGGAEPHGAELKPVGQGAESCWGALSPLQGETGALIVGSC